MDDILISRESTDRGDTEELTGLVKNIAAMAAESTHVIFNNNYGDQGQRNARELRMIVERLG